MKEAVIFDMDGVIVDSESRHEQAFLEVVEQIGYGGRHGLRFEDYVGRTDHALWQDFMAINQPPHALEDLLEMKNRRVVEIIRRDQPLFAGLPELVEVLSRHYRLALASGSERSIVNEVLALRGLGRFFGATLTGSEIKRGKPDPEIFLRAAALLGVEPAQCWVIEDSKPGVIAGLAAGMRVIAITNTHPRADLLNANRVVSTYQEIEHLLLGTTGQDFAF
jgi:HAD superfamily hydrolase (TIGR01509 family)